MTIPSTVLLGAAIVAIIALAIFLIILIIKLNNKKQEMMVSDILSELSGEEETINIKMFPIEKSLITKLNIKSKSVRFAVWAIRIIIILLIFLSFAFLGYAGIAISAALIIWLILDAQLRNEIEASGINRITNTVTFMDHFRPAITSGKSAKQAFLNYVHNLTEDDEIKPLLLEYIDAQETKNYSYKTPISISDITSIYEMARYNEAKGVDDYTYIIEEAKDDLFQKSEYYTDYNSKVGEVLKPIQFAYIIGVPVIIIILFPTLGGFWFEPIGLVIAIVIVLIFCLFKFLINKLHINTLHKIL